MSLDQAIGATLLADPKIRAGLEAIHQANGDLLTSSLPPNPSLIVEGQYLPLRPFTPQQPGGPSEFDLQVGYPIDWFLFGKLRGGDGQRPLRRAPIRGRLRRPDSAACDRHGDGLL